MKISKRQLKRIIREAINEYGARSGPMTPQYVMDSLTNGKSALTGKPFMVKAMAGLKGGDYNMTANAIMDALWIDDPPRGAEEELEHILSQQARTPDDLAAIGAEWGTRHFRSR